MLAKKLPPALDCRQSKHTLVEKLLEIHVAKYERKIPSLAEVGALKSC